MFWTILPHASVCIASDRIILLDRRRDRYFMVPPAQSRLIGTWLTKGASGPLPDIWLALLTSSGVLAPGDVEPCCVQNTMTTIRAPAPDCGGSVAVGFDTMAAVSYIVMTTAHALKRRPLENVLSDHRTRGSASGRDPERQCVLIRSFEAARRFVPIERRCLVDSLALKRWLRRHGQYAELVFGVAGLPFAAHCWLQSDGALLNDSYDRVSRFTPIAVQ